MKRAFILIVAIMLASVMSCSDQRAASGLDSRLILACGDPETTTADVTAMIDEGANPTAQAFDGSTALHIAASLYYNEEIVKLLIAKGADPNAEDGRGQTPLHVAATYGDRCVSVAEALIAAGGSVNARDVDGKTPLAVTQGNEQMMAFLADKGGVL